jgi:hypothetical protein
MEREIIYKENKAFVLEYLKQGMVDYFDFSSWPFQDHFFAFLLSTHFFSECANTYPNPRKKQEVPLWILLVCEILLKLHTTSSHSRLPGILKSGPILSRIKFNLQVNPNGGFNNKNKKKRDVVLHHDSVRKFFKATEPDKLRRWYNNDFIRFLRRKRAFDKQGIFLLDQSHIVVPRNRNYIGVDYLLVDEFGHRIDTTGMSVEARKSLKSRPCYTVSEIVHVNKYDQCAIVSGYDWGGGKEDELPQARRMVDMFVNSVGKGVMKILVVDRGYIDGAFITYVKQKYNIDVVVPLRKNMEMLRFGIQLAQSDLCPDNWKVYQTYVKNHTTYTEEVICIPDTYTWDECDVMLHLSLMRVISSDENEEPVYWGLATTYKPKNVKDIFDTYKLRSKIEERYRQHKHFWNLHKFSSPSISLMETHVAFTLMTYSLLQLFLNKRHLTDLANKTIETLREEQKLGKDSVIVYKKNNFAVLDFDFYTELIADMPYEGRKKIKERIQQLRKMFHQRGPSNEVSSQ